MKGWLSETIDFAMWVWRELHRTDLGDDTHYPNGLRKWSDFPLISRMSLIISLIALAVNCLTPLLR